MFHREADTRRPRRSGTKGASARRQLEPAPVAAASPAPQQGVLPIVTDQFATVTVVPNEELRRQGGSHARRCAVFQARHHRAPALRRALPVGRSSAVSTSIASGSSKTASAASGASDLGEDHFVPIDPLATNQVEVVRGPAALRYGSTSIGGVVSATNNRIPRRSAEHARPRPSRLLDCRSRRRSANVPSPSCVTVETRTAVSSVDRGVEGGILLDAGGGNFAVHADAYGRKASDYNIPSYPYLFDQTAPGERPPAEFGRAGRRRLGRRLLHLPRRLYRRGDHADRLALSYPRHRRGGSPHPHRRPSDQTHRKGRISARRGGCRCRQVLGAAPPTTTTTRSALPILPIPRTDGVRQTFTNKEQEGRVEVQMMPFNARFATR